MSIDLANKRPVLSQDQGHGQGQDEGVETRPELIKEFVATNPNYYEQQFNRIGSQSSFTWTFNFIAALLGPIWYGMRGLWNWGLPFAVLETYAYIQITRGFWGDLAIEARERIEKIEGTLNFRKQQLQAAIDNNADNVDVFRRTIESLENGIGEIRQEVIQLEESGIWVAISGLVTLAVVKGVQGVLGNFVLERRFSEWLSDRSIKSGLELSRILLSSVFVIIVFLSCIIHFSFPNVLNVLSAFPTDPEIRTTSISLVKEFFGYIILKGELFFDVITIGIRIILDSLELVFVQTPWLVIASFIVLLTGLSAGPRSAIWSGAFLAYMGLLGFWVKAMTTLALLGTAALLSIAIGIPLGMFCARRPRLYAVIRPIMDFMQTMPAFVFMIPVIAFFGTGKPAAIVTTMIFGGTPIVRLTVLGLRGVPESVREAAIAYGASKFYLLTKVDLPLASPSILAGVNQTIMLSLAMVVVASLIGAKGLGEDVLEALQYASVGQGILAGFAILFCAMILDRIVQGKRKGQ
ncbi:MAG: ABC transporter permease subunit [Gammaproteobacteria bacterium]|nr:ABC transporter permease subunit [Gammaproteobacteria bacterium]